MAKLIEICGTNGIGKSTILKVLNNNWNKNSSWITSDHLFPKKKISFSNLDTFLLSTYRYLGRLKFDPEPLKEAGSRFLISNQNFVDQFLLLLTTDKKFGYNGVDLRFENIPYFFKAIEKVQFIRESESDKIVLLDEGFIHHIGRLVNKDDNLDIEKKSIKELLRLTPLPDAIINLELEVEENAKRLVIRNKVLNMLENLEYGEIVNFVELSQNRRKIINKILASQGVPILNINTKDALGNNIESIESFIDKIHTSPTTDIESR